MFNLLEPNPAKADVDVGGCPKDGVLNENAGAADAAPKPPKDAPKPLNAGCARKNSLSKYIMSDGLNGKEELFYEKCVFTR